MTYSIAFLTIVGLCIILLCIELLFSIASENDFKRQKLSTYDKALRDFNRDLHRAMLQTSLEKSKAISKVKRRYKARIDKLHKEVAVLRRVVADLHRGHYK